MRRRLWLEVWPRTWALSAYASRLSSRGCQWGCGLQWVYGDFRLGVHSTPLGSGEGTLIRLLCSIYGPLRASRLIWGRVGAHGTDSSDQKGFKVLQPSLYDL